MEKLTQEMKDDYEKFLTEIPQLLIDLQSALSSSKKYHDLKVEFSDETLEAIEQFYLDVLKRREKPIVPRKRLERAFEAFIGEAVIRRAGGEWTLGKDHFTFGTPSVAAEGTLVWSPRQRRKLLADDKEPFLKRLVDYNINRERYEREIFGDAEPENEMPEVPIDELPHLPLLDIPRDSDSDVLLNYELNNTEQELFDEMDTAVAELPEDCELEANYDVVSIIGAKFGLSVEQSIAFWTRSTFSLFEE